MGNRIRSLVWLERDHLGVGFRSVEFSRGSGRCSVAGPLRTVMMPVVVYWKCQPVMEWDVQNCSDRFCWHSEFRDGKVHLRDSFMDVG